MKYDHYYISFSILRFCLWRFICCRRKMFPQWKRRQRKFLMKNRVCFYVQFETVNVARDGKKNWKKVNEKKSPVKWPAFLPALTHAVNLSTSSHTKMKMKSVWVTHNKLLKDSFIIHPSLSSTSHSLRAHFFRLTFVSEEWMKTHCACGTGACVH